MKDNAFVLLWTVIVAAVLSFVYSSGLDRVKTKAVQQDRAQQSAQVAEKVAAVDRQVLPQHAAAVGRIETITKETIREVPVFVPAGTCTLPPGWRVLHDAAAAGEVPDPTRVPDAAPVDPDAAASAVAANYGACHVNAQRLQDLQSWVEGVSR